MHPLGQTWLPPDGATVPWDARWFVDSFAQVLRHSAVFHLMHAMTCHLPCSLVRFVATAIFDGTKE